MKTSFFSKWIFLMAVMSGATAQGGCLTDLGPYPDDYGWAIFPFKNACDQQVTVNLCVKSWPPGSEDPAYNLYSGTVYGNDQLELTDGKYDTIDSYRWTEDGYQSCPFE